MLIFAAAMALLAPADHPGMPMADGFVVGYRQTAQMGAIEERVPRGETVQDWSRMVTLLTMNVDMTPEAYLDAFARQIATACPGATVGPRTASITGAYKSLDGRTDCALNPGTGKPETFFYRIFAAGGRLYMAQVAFRRVANASDAAWARSQLSGLRLCAVSATDAVCTL